jgi:DNA-binding transcriptional regulator YhcF (GntR family)
MSDHGLTPEHEQRDLRAHDLERLVEEQIRAGVYEEGARLPTVREVAQRYGVNKNTASRAYQALERRGLIDMSRGRGAFVRLPLEPGATWQQRIEQLVHEARQLGVGRPQLLDAMSHTVERIYGPEAPRALFVECNPQDLEALGAELSTITGSPIELALLDEALRSAGALARRYDLLVTTFQHLGQLRQATPAEARSQVIGVHVLPTHDSLLELARLHVATFGLVCDTPSTIESLSHIISTYNPAAAILPALIDDEAQLRHVAVHADAIVVTRSCLERLTSLDIAQPIVTVVFTIDQQSIDFLRRRLHDLSELRAGLVAP